jgi:methylthioribose-1-phosphate isomerase
MKQLLTIEWIPSKPGKIVPGFIRAIDQTRLPGQRVFLKINDVKKLGSAIRSLQIRGAPAIGVSAAFGIVLAAQRNKSENVSRILADIKRAADYLASSRPTAVNLFWALDRMCRKALRMASLPAGKFLEKLAKEAIAIWNEDRQICRKIGQHGLRLLKGRKSILTHCNAGGLATVQYGTALAPIYLMHQKGQRIKVFVDETRPLLQGARLTTWELKQAGIDVTLICDNMAARVMKEKKVDAVFVGADRIAANGDTANKIGTYGLAVLAKAHKIPFYVFAPTSTFDLKTPHGGLIPIEERGRKEVTHGFGKQIAPDGVKVYSPAFDVTPARLISAIICEHGICRPPYEKSLRYAYRLHGYG